jgi:hypothetical protein
MKFSIPNDIGRTWDLLKGSGPVEAFFNKGDTHRTRFYTDRDTFIKETAFMNAESFTCYAGIQPRIDGVNASATNEGIKFLHKLYMDIDPERPKGTNSTDEEKAEALKVARKIQTDFESQGYQRPVVGDSGNGYWIIFSIPEIRIDETNRPEIQAKLKAWGKELIDKYSNDDVTLDDVYDLKRITKIFGTKVFNKPESENRPQRVSGFLDDHEPIPDEKLREDFLSIPVEVEAETARSTPEGRDPFNIDRLFDRCYTLRFLKEKSDAGTNLSHSVRLGLSTLSLALNDLENGMPFIKLMLQGCPDFDEKKTRYYLERNSGKGSPYGCQALRTIVSDHFSDFDIKQCDCQLPVTRSQDGKERKPSPIRFAGFMAEDLEAMWQQLEKTDDTFRDYLTTQSFSREFLSQVPKDTARAFLSAKKDEGELKTGSINDLLKTAGEVNPVKKGPTQAEILIKLADAAEVFRDFDQKAYATFRVNNHKETWRVRSATFKKWLVHQFYDEQKKPPGGQALTDSINHIEAKAMFRGSQKDVFTRIAHSEDRIFIDLCNDRWECVEITRSGYQVLPEPPVKFKRSNGMLALPHPVKGSMEDLRAFLNVKTNADWSLIGGWLVGAYSQGPYPVLLLQGPQGTAKSTISKMLKALVDPSTAPLRTLPKDVRDLMIAASNGWIVAFDNLSGLPVWMSDCICRLSTGGGLATRELYTDGGETLFNAMRPQMLNGIDDIATRHDLVDRAIMVDLEAIPERMRKPEKELWAAFERVRPQILGGIFDAVAGALRNQDSISFERLPRMADFAIWAAAAEKETPWAGTGSFMRSYDGNRNAAIQMAVDSDLVASGIMGLLLLEDGKWEGTSTELLDRLCEIVSEKAQKSKSWPKQPHFLTGKIKRAATFLKSLGVDIVFPDRSKKKREYLISSKGSAESGQGSAEKPSAAPFSGTKHDEGNQDVTGSDFGGSAGSAEIPSLTNLSGFLEKDSEFVEHEKEVIITI